MELDRRVSLSKSPPTERQTSRILTTPNDLVTLSTTTLHIPTVQAVVTIRKHLAEKQVLLSRRGISSLQRFRSVWRFSAATTLHILSTR